MSDDIDEDAPVEQTATAFPDAGVVTIGKVNYAAGLIWNRKDLKKDSKTSLVTIAKKDAQDYGAELFAIRKISNQYALGSIEAGHKSGMPILADTLAQGINGTTWTGVFPIGEDIYYCVAVQNNIIVAGVDKIIHGKETALEEFSDMFLRGTDWEFAFAPSDFELQRTVDKSLEDVLGKTKPVLKLSPVSNKGLLVKAGGILLLMGLLFLAYSQYEAYVERTQLAEIAANQKIAEQQKIARAQKLAEENARLKIQIPELPWNNKPIFAAALDACETSMDNAPMEIPGWSPLSLTCSGTDVSNGVSEGYVTLALKRDGGTINWIAPFVNKPNFHPSVRTMGSNGAITGVEVTWEIKGYAKLPHYTNDSPTLGLPEVRKHIISNSEESFVNTRLADVAGVTVEIMGPDNKPQTIPVSKGLSFGFNVIHNPRDLLKMISPLPVVTMSKVSLDIVNWKWIVEGVAHERIPLPPDAKPYIKPAGAPAG